MKKRIANAVELVLLIVLYIIMSVPCVGLVTGGSVSILGASQDNALLYYPMWAFLLLCVIMCIVSIVFKNNQKDGRIHSILAILLFIVVNLNAMTCVSGSRIAQNDFPVAFFEIVLFLIVVVSFVKRSALIVSAVKEQPQVIQNAQEVSSADELMKFKSLLDQGAITQEEYDKKKSELLNK